MKFIAVIFLILTQSLWASDAIRSYRVSSHQKYMQVIASRFEVVKKLDNGYEVYVLEEKAKDFLKLAPDAVLLQKNIHSELENKIDKKYRKFVDVEKELISYSTAYPDFAKLITYGTSKEKRNLYALKVETKINQGNKPTLMITSATHGDELITVEVLMTLIKEMFSNYGKDERITKMLDNHTIYFIPMVTPDSFEARSRYVEGEDPNRCYPWPGDPNNKPVSVIQSIMNFTNSINLNGSLDLHAYGQLVMYPWGYTEESPTNSADVVSMNSIVHDMARENKYTAGQISTTIYIAQGNSADYYYWNKKTRAIAAEIGTEKIPSYSRIPAVVNESREMIFRFIENFN